MALELARSGADLRACVGLHGLPGADASPEPGRPIAARILVCMGAEDPQIPKAERESFAREMQAAGASWRMNVYGKALNGFTNPDAASIGRPDAVRFDRTAAVGSWATMQHVLAEALGSPA